MIGMKKTKPFKIIAIALVFLFIYQSVYSLPAGNRIIPQFEKAKEEYLNKDYQSAKERLKRLIYVLDKKRVKLILLARIYLLLAASCEKTHKLKDAKKFYKKSMRLWRKVPDGGEQTDNRKIVKEKNVPYIFECNFNDLKYYRKYILRGNRNFPWLLVTAGVVAVGVIVSLLVSRPKYTLTVTKGEGVEGYPESGTNIYKKGTTVNYNYSLQQGYTYLTVTIDSEASPNSGTITMDSDHTLIATTNERVNLHVESTPTGADVYIDNIRQGRAAPCDLVVDVGNHEIRLVEATWGEAKNSINFEKNTNYNLNVKLSGYTYEYVNKWGSYGSGSGQFNGPRGIAVDKKNHVYVVDSGNNRIQKFDFNGIFIYKWGSEGTGVAQFRGAAGIACDQNNYVYVIEAANNRIQKFDSNGMFITKWGSPGGGSGELDWPRNLAVDKNNYVYAADSGNNRIQKFDSNGNFITKWGSYGTDIGQFYWPWGTAVDENNYVYIGDRLNYRVQKFDTNGNFITKWGSHGTDDGQFNEALDIVIDKNNYLYISSFSRVQKFDDNGTFITKWGSWGTYNGQFVDPYYLAVDENGIVLVSDFFTNRIQAFRMTNQTGDDGEWTINSTPGTAENSSISKGFSPVKVTRKLTR